MITALRTVRRWHGPLAWFAALMAGLAVVAAVGYVADPRILVGVPIWAKPLKFAISFVLYAVTLAWMLSLVRRPWLRTAGWWAGTVLAAASTLEMTAIVLQVVRGQQSHFNVSTEVNALVFTVMGVLVGVIYLCTLLIAVALIASPLADRAITWAVRLGTAIAVGGLSVGFLMLVPTPAQVARSGAPTLSGAHSVDVPDGGPGLPLLGWSTTGGDLRVAHFLGMHALQVLPLVAIALTLLPAAARLSDRTRLHIVLLTAFAYTGVVALTLWQALRGQPVTAPDTATLLVLAALVTVLGLGVLVSVRSARRRPRIAVPT